MMMSGLKMLSFQAMLYFNHRLRSVSRLKSDMLSHFSNNLVE